MSESANEAIVPADKPALPAWRKRAGNVLLALSLVVLGVVLYWRNFHQTGTVELRIAEAGAEIFIDGEKISFADDSGSVRINLPPGNHDIKAIKEGCRPFTKEFAVAADELDMIYVVMEPDQPRPSIPRPKLAWRIRLEKNQ